MTACTKKSVISLETFWECLTLLTCCGGGVWTAGKSVREGRSLMLCLQSQLAPWTGMVRPPVPFAAYTPSFYVNQQSL